MKKITFVLPSRNNLEFLQLSYQSIRNLSTIHEVLILDDASIDGTKEWIESLNDPDLITYYNTGPDRIGIVGMFDKGIAMARTEIIFAFHADMIAGVNLDTNILKHLRPGTVVSATRIEPSLHPPGPEKVLKLLKVFLRHGVCINLIIWLLVAMMNYSHRKVKKTQIYSIDLY